MPAGKGVVKKTTTPLFCNFNFQHGSEKIFKLTKGYALKPKLLYYFFLSFKALKPIFSNLSITLYIMESYIALVNY